MGREYLILAALSLILLLPNLGDRILSGDEAYTAMVGETILQNGVPTAFYKNILINPKPEAWERVFSYPLYTWISWIQFYISAAMSALFGVSAFWQRIPFITFGLASILLTFRVIERLTNNKSTAWVTSLLVLSSATFLLHARQARWYMPALFFTLALLYGYWKAAEDKKPGLFIASSIMLFHTNQLHFFEIMFAIGSYHLLFRRKSVGLKNAGVWLSGIFIGIFPWFFITNQFEKIGGASLNPFNFALNLSLNFYYIFVLISPFLMLMAYYFIYKKEEYEKFFLSIIFFCILFLSVKSNHLPAVRYIINILPLLFWINAEVIMWTYRRQKEIAVGIGLLLVLTNIIHIIPFAIAKDSLKEIPIPVSQYEKDKFVESSLSTRSPLMNYVYEITHEYTSVEEAIIRIMKDKGKPGEEYFTSDFIHTLAIYLPEFGISGLQERSKMYKKENNKEDKRDDKNIQEGNYDMKDSQDITHRTPDWIIPRKFYLRPERAKGFISEIRNINLEEYQKILIPLADERWADTPDPLNHQYWDMPGKVEIYYRGLTK